VRIGKPMQFDPETDPEEIVRALQAAVENLPNDRAQVNGGIAKF